MASIIRIKRSSGTDKPSALQWGELGYVTGIGSAIGAAQQNKDRIYVGDDGTNVNAIGGRYYTAMMDHVPGQVAGLQGTNTRNTDSGVAALMAPLANTGLGGALSLKVDQWNVDNLRIDGNEITSTDTDGDIKLDPNGSGEVHIPDDTFLSFGDDKDAKIEYDENGVDQLTFTGADVRINVTTESTDKDTGALIVEGGVGVEGNINAGGSISIGGHAIFDSVKIEDNVISTLSGSSDTLFIDPYPDGLSNEGTVIIKGSLQVDGTTTSVNSTTSTLNDPIFHIGDLTSSRTVMATVSSGANTITLDSVVGINTGDVVSGNAALSASGVSTVTAYNIATKVITVDATTTSGISTGTQLTVTHAYNTNTDRGISFAYNTATGTSNGKTGFFGYIDQTNPNSSAVSRSWTYIPDATIANSLASGTRGYLDIKGIYYQTGDYNTHGLVYFDVDGLQTSTNNPADVAALSFNNQKSETSKQIMTALTENTLTLGTAVTLAKGDIIKQDTSGAFGVVKAAVSGGTSVTVWGVEGTFNTTNNLRKEGSNGSIADLGSIPSNVAVIYTNKPTWTAALDGGTF